MGIALVLAGCNTPTHLKTTPLGGPGRDRAAAATAGLDAAARNSARATALVDSAIDAAGNHGAADQSKYAGYAADPEALKAQAVYFDLDKSAIRASEQSKLDAVASYLKSNPDKALRVEGNCDERGTEEYNRSLGERRAMAAREFLITHPASTPTSSSPSATGTTNPPSQATTNPPGPKTAGTSSSSCSPPRL